MLINSIKIIVNPKAGGGEAGRMIHALSTALQAAEIPASIDHIYRPGGGTFLADRALEQGFRTLIAVGGDGTVHEIAQSLLNHPSHDTLLGIFPSGTGNDFAKSLGLPTTIDTFIGCLTKRQIRPIDIGKVNDRFFLNAFGIGLDAAIAGEVNRAPLKSKRSYFSMTLRTLFRFKPIPLTLQVGTNPPYPITPSLFTIMNGKYLGNYFLLSPDANLTDGQLNVHYAPTLPKLKMLIRLRRLMRGEGSKIKELQSFTTNEIMITPHAMTLAHADGETFTADRYHITIEPKKLPLLTH